MTPLQEPPAAGNELDTLLGALERQRRYIAWKCGGLDAAGLRTTLGPSTITLGGLLKHLAVVEEHTFAVKLFGRPMNPPFADVDWDADPDWEWHSAASDPPESLMARWEASVARARELVAAALAEGGLDLLGVAAWPDGRRASLRRHLIDMIEEYARHVGHADLIRESIDGVVGEDPLDDQAR
ncbi:DinB family protein [Asanoa sp. WMMD1127]|uniref:DinB family protein n=1 Tax=Asanoa sp. WMMD1127 TaxID=3016107 RepID=UPI002415FABA|nr:DinB family protein [Asanoa sp. WMMD1127]MDG4824071.1 DinB family protein [Asanoa sp. WMMD1127]